MNFQELHRLTRHDHGNTKYPAPSLPPAAARGTIRIAAGRYTHMKFGKLVRDFIPDIIKKMARIRSPILPMR